MICFSYGRCLSFKVRFHSLRSFKPTFFSLPRRGIALSLAFGLALSLLAAVSPTLGNYAASASSTASHKQRVEHRAVHPAASRAARFYSAGLPAACPASFTVNDPGDSPDAAPGDELCRDASLRCTLRAAIEEVNALPACASFVINFSVTGTINLASALPDLDHPNLTILGPGANQLTVRRNTGGDYRIFNIPDDIPNVTITGMTITNGKTAAFGGGIRARNTSTTVNDCLITGNQAGTGGGISAVFGALTLNRTTVTGNTAALGAGIYTQDEISVIRDSTISGNTGAEAAGFVCYAMGNNTMLTLINSTVSGNTATSQDAAFRVEADAGLSSTLTLRNSTVTNNVTANAGQPGAIWLRPSAGTVSLTLMSSIVSGNLSGGAFSDITGSAVAGSSFNLIGVGGGLTGGVNGNQTGVTNPQLAALANNGGSTNTHLPLPGSPAIDKGGAGLSTDQRGQARPLDIPGVANAAGGNGSDIGAVEIQCAPSTLAALPGGAAGVAYNVSNIASGGAPPYGLSLTAGSLPPGITISGNGLTGTPTQVGAFNFTLTATDVYGCTGSRAYTVNIACPPITPAPAGLPNATVNSAYPQTLTAAPAGGNYSFALTGGLLPTGLTLNANGTFSGAPTQSGVFNFRVTATGFGSCSGFTDHTLLVNCPIVTVAPAGLPNGTLGTAYNQSAGASPAGTYSYSVTSGALPNGLTLNGANGAITGTPAAAGTFNFTVTAASGTGGACAGSRNYTVAIGCAVISFTTASPLPAGQAGIAYSQTLGVTPAGAYTFSLTSGNLPSGLTLHPSTGLISGTPTVNGNFAFTVKAQTANGCQATQNYTLAIGCPTVSLSPTGLPNGATGTAYNQSLSAGPAGGNYVFAVSAGSLPPGLTLNSATGVLSGTPSASSGGGTFNFTVTATGFGACSGNRAYSITIGSGGCPTITLPAGLPGGSAGQLYNQSVAASPAGSYSYTVAGNLPPGVPFYASLGLLLGYPTANGTYNFSVTATDANSCSATQSYSVVIGAGSSPAAINDFSGDRKSDFVQRTAQAQWLIVDSATGAAQSRQWGQAGDLAVGGDYDGDGKADLAGFGKDGHWRIKLSGGGTLDKLWGLGSDVPVPGDYDGDGKTDLAVWRGAETNWHIQRSSDGRTQTVSWGSSLSPYNDVPVPGDYDGDGKTDVAVFRQASVKEGGKDGGHWYIRRSSDGKMVTKAWGLGADVPVPADFDGDGRTDIAVWRGSEGNWYIINSSEGTVEVKFWGAGYAPYFDAPAVGDYDGDGKADAAIRRKSDNRWYVLQSSDGAVKVVTPN